MDGSSDMSRYRAGRARILDGTQLVLKSALRAALLAIAPGLSVDAFAAAHFGPAEANRKSPRSGRKRLCPSSFGISISKNNLFAFAIFFSFIEIAHADAGSSLIDRRLHCGASDFVA
jgi:hypothetical protein